jgi:hypothetical protein
MTFNTFYPVGHHIRLRFLLAKGLSADETDLLFMTPHTVGPFLVMATQTLHFRPEDLSVLLSGCMADLAVQDPCDMLPMGEGMIVNPDLGILKSLVTLVALRMGDLYGFG